MWTMSTDMLPCQQAAAIIGRLGGAACVLLQQLPVDGSWPMAAHTQSRASYLSPSDTWIALSTTIWKTLEYPLAALMLSDDDLKTIVWPIISVVLPKNWYATVLSEITLIWTN